MTEGTEPGLSTPRLCAPPGATVVFDSAGFVVAPGSMYPAQNPEVSTIADLSSVECLVLLGDPGIGKSTVLASEQQRLTNDGEEVISLDLAGIADLSDLTTQLFATGAWARWRDGSSQLILFLDTLDEALLRIPKLRRALPRELRAVDSSRLQLRIACRGANWHATLTDDFASLWTSPPTLRYLLPLRRSDVEHAAAEAPGVDPDAFVSQVLERGVVPLATSPLTLGLLLRTMAAGGSLPATQIETYRRGLLLLCEEPDRERAESPQTGDELSAGARVAVAERIAAAVLVSGATSVWDGPDDGRSPAASIVRQALTGGTEEDDSGAVPTSVNVNENAMRETLRTAVFAGRSGTAELVFAHQSFGEFLAASWLNHLGFERAASLLCMPNDPARPLVPQLREVTAWLGLMNSDALAYLLENDVELLLRPDLSQQPPETRAAVLHGLIALLDRGAISLYDGPLRERLSYLNGPQLADQLRTVLTAPERPTAARQFACIVAGACRLPDLADALIDLAHDTEAGGRVRTEAVLSLEGVVDDSVRARLSDLTSERSTDHDTDELKGAVLRLVWPDALTAEQLFATIAPPHEPNTLGLYRAFLGSELVAGLAEADLVTALTWAGDHYDPYSLDDLAQLALQIMVRCWSEITTNPKIADLFAQIARQLLADHLILFQYATSDTEDLFVTEAERREVVARLVEAVAAGELEPTRLAQADPALLLTTDLPWVLERLTASLQTDHERVWALLADQLWPYADDASAATIWKAREMSTELDSLTAPRFEAVPLDSPLAAQNRKWYKRSQRIQQQRAEHELAQREWDASIAQRLTQALSDPKTAWPELSSLLTGARREPPLHEARQRTVDSPGYAHLDHDAHASLIDAADRFLAGTPERDVPQPSNLATATSIAAVRAMDLLLESAPERLAALEPDLWNRWSRAVVVHPIESGAKRDALEELQGRATAANRSQVANELLGVLRAENHRNGRAWQLEHAAAFASPELESGLLDMLEAGGVLPDAAGDVISFGIRRRSEPLRAWALAIVARVGELGWASQDYGIAKKVAAVLIDKAPDRGWPAVWDAMQRSELWAREVIPSLVGNRNPEQLAALDEPKLAALYVWVRERYPVEEDPAPSAIVGARGQLGWWRDALATALASRATEQAVSELAALGRRFSDDLYLKRLHADADTARQRAAWRPPRPQAVIELGINRNRRPVSSDLDLQDVVPAPIAAGVGIAAVVGVIITIATATPWLKGAAVAAITGVVLLHRYTWRWPPAPWACVVVAVAIASGALVGHLAAGGQTAPAKPRLGQPPPLADQWLRERAQIENEGWQIITTQQLNLRGNGRPTTLLVLNPTIGSVCSGPNATRSQEIRLYDVDDGWLRKAFAFQPSQRGCAALTFSILSTSDIALHGHSEVLGAYSGEPNISVAGVGVVPFGMTIPVFLSWDDASQRYTIAALIQQPPKIAVISYSNGQSLKGADRLWYEAGVAIFHNQFDLGSGIRSFVVSNVSFGHSGTAGGPILLGLYRLNAGNFGNAAGDQTPLVYQQAIWALTADTGVLRAGACSLTSSAVIAQGPLLDPKVALRRLASEANQVIQGCDL